MPSMEKVSCSEETVGGKRDKKAGIWWQLTFISGHGYVKSCQLNKSLLSPPKKSPKFSFYRLCLIAAQVCMLCFGCGLYNPVVRNKHAWPVDIQGKCQGSQCDSESLSEKFQLDFTPNYCNLFGEVKLLYCAAKPVYKVRLFTYKNIVRNTLGRNRLKIDSVWGQNENKASILFLAWCYGFLMLSLWKCGV